MGWGSMTPHGCRHSNWVAGEEPATSSSKGRGEPQPGQTRRTYTLVGRTGDKRREGDWPSSNAHQAQIWTTKEEEVLG